MANLDKYKNQQSPFVGLLNGKYRDTDQPASSPGEYLDSLLGAPVRTAISEYQNSTPTKEALSKILKSFGSDPKNAPTGYDIASKAGIQNPYLGAAAATAVDLGAQLPVGEIASIAKEIPMAGRLADSLSEAKGLLSNIDTPEKASALTGDDRQNYLSALDQVFGSRDQRAKDLGFGNRTWYHGTTVPIDEFKDEAKGLSTGAQSAKKGFFFAQDPSTASDYADLAREKGVIREGDTVTTKWQSENYDEPEKVSFQDVDAAKQNWYEAQQKTSDFLNSKKQELDKNMSSWDEARTNPDKFKWSLQGRTGDQLADEMQQKLQDRYNRFYGDATPSTPDEIANAKQAYFDKMKDFNSSNPDLANKINGIYLETRNPEEKELLKSAISAGRDVDQSTGQNVVPVRLAGNKDTIHVKDYGGEGYRDTTYADEMSTAQENGKSGILFKNTEDPADPYNRVTQDIAAVFNPNQIRSVNAAFDPRFKDSSNLLAGQLGTNPIQSNLGLMSKSSSSFDPDQYLSEKKASSSEDDQTFDPDKYLSEKAP